MCVLLESTNTLQPPLPGQWLPPSPPRGAQHPYLPAGERAASLAMVTKEGPTLPMGLVHLLSKEVRAVQERALYATPYKGASPSFVGPNPVTHACAQHESMSSALHTSHHHAW